MITPKTLTALLLATAAFMPTAQATSSGPPAGTSGVPSGGEFEAESNCVQCHNSYQLNPDDQGKLQLLNVPTTYIPGQAYQLTLNLSHPTARRWGFQLTAVQSDSLRGAGDFSPVKGDKSTQRLGGVNRNYIEHGAKGRKATGVGKAQQYQWQFEWIAPKTNIGEIHFYGFGNASNMDGSQGGDKIYGSQGKPLATVKATTISVAAEK